VQPDVVPIGHVLRQLLPLDGDKKIGLSDEIVSGCGGLTASLFGKREIALNPFRRLKP